MKHPRALVAQRRELQPFESAPISPGRGGAVGAGDDEQRPEPAGRAGPIDHVTARRALAPACAGNLAADQLARGFGGRRGA